VLPLTEAELLGPLGYPPAARVEAPRPLRLSQVATVTALVPLRWPMWSRAMTSNLRHDRRVARVLVGRRVFFGFVAPDAGCLSHLVGDGGLPWATHAGTYLRDDAGETVAPLGEGW